MTDTSIIARPRSLDETGQRPWAHLPGSPVPPFQIQGTAIHLGDDAEDWRAAANCSFRIDFIDGPDAHLCRRTEAGLNCTGCQCELKHAQPAPPLYQIAAQSKPKVARELIGACGCGNNPAPLRRGRNLIGLQPLAL
jgi:hypothetical protein